jgi:catechol 2,3-dioxygenase-like lactoylglutathione lyase family enzyme
MGGSSTQCADEEPPMTCALASLDHLLLGTSDLDRGIAWFEEKTGVRADVGGAHPGRGTRNALAGLGGRRYLEIIAPDPVQPPENLQMNLRDLRKPRLIRWAALATDIDALATRILEAGGSTAGPRDGSRARPDRQVLTWRTLAVDAGLADAQVDPIPFFIEWSRGTPHPSEDAPPGCELTGFDFEHPDAKAVETALGALRIDAAVRQAPETRLIATLTTPRGRVVLT